MLSLDLVHRNATDSTTAAARRRSPATPGTSAEVENTQADISSVEDSDTGPTILEKLEQASPTLRELFDALDEHCATVGDGIRRKETQRYIGFQRAFLFAALKIRPIENKIVVQLKIDPDTVEPKNGFTRDLRTSKRVPDRPLEVTVRQAEDLEPAYALIERAYANG